LRNISLESQKGSRR